MYDLPVHRNKFTKLKGKIIRSDTSPGKWAFCAICQATCDLLARNLPSPVIYQQEICPHLLFIDKKIYLTCGLLTRKFTSPVAY